MAALARRKFLQSAISLSGLPLVGFSEDQQTPEKLNAAGNRFKLSLNCYSFNSPLLSGATNFESVIDFCAVQGFDAIDMTGYYFPGYPEAPPDTYIYQLKRKLHRLGLAVSGTGIRNDFSQADKMARAKEIILVKRWIEVAAKLGAPVLRIYSGKGVPENYTWDAVAEWIAEDFKTCAEYGEAHGVIVAMQNHNDFLKTAGQCLDLLQRVNSEWFGQVVDTGNFNTNEPYSEIEKTAPNAVNWQVKEQLTIDGKITDMDLVKLFRIIKASAYRGYLPIETLSPGDPYVIVPPFLQQVKAAMEKVLNE